MLPGSASEKRAAACAALLNTKLDVGNIGSECSPSAVRVCPARMASVANRYSGSEDMTAYLYSGLRWLTSMRRGLVDVTAHPSHWDEKLILLVVKTLAGAQASRDRV